MDDISGKLPNSYIYVVVKCYITIKSNNSCLSFHGRQTPVEFQQEYKMRAKRGGYEILDTTAAQLHDDIWGIALALNATMSIMDSNNGEIIAETGCDLEDYSGNLLPLENFTYNNKKMGCLIAWNLRKTNFTGVSVNKNNMTLYQNIFVIRIEELLSYLRYLFKCRERYSSMRVSLIIQ